MLSLPVIMEAETILILWLKIVPDYTIPFMRILFCIMIVDAVARPLMTAAAATGDVKKYQSILGGILLTIVPIAYLVLKLGGSPTSVYVVHLSVASVVFVVRLVIVRPMIKLSLRCFFNFVILPCFFVATISFAISYVTKHILPEGLIYSVIVCLVCIFSVISLSYFIGITKEERAFVNEKIRVVVRRIFQGKNS